MTLVENKMSIEKLTTIRLSGQLGRKFGKVHQFFVASPAEAVRALCSQIEGFEAYLKDETRQTRYKVFVAKAQIDPEKDLHNLSGSKEIRIAPQVQGAKSGGLFQTVLGAVLIAVSIWNPMGWVALGASGAFGTTMMFSMGVSMMLGGIAQMLSPQPKLNIEEAPNNKPNTSLGVVNAVSQGRPVPLVYGECIVGSVVASAGVYASDTNFQETEVNTSAPSGQWKPKLRDFENEPPPPDPEGN